MFKHVKFAKATESQTISSEAAYENERSYDSVKDYLKEKQLAHALKIAIEQHGMSPGLYAFINHNNAFSNTDVSLESLVVEHPDHAARQILEALETLDQNAPSLEDFKSAMRHMQDRFQKKGLLHKLLGTFAFVPKAGCTYAEAQNAIKTMIDLNKTLEELLKLSVKPSLDMQADINAVIDTIKKSPYIKNVSYDREKNKVHIEDDNTKFNLTYTPTIAAHSGFTEENFKQTWNKLSDVYYDDNFDIVEKQIEKANSFDDVIDECPEDIKKEYVRWINIYFESDCHIQLQFSGIYDKLNSALKKTKKDVNLK